MSTHQHHSLFNFNLSERFDWLTGEESPLTGKVFINPQGGVEDLSNVNILHMGVDTLKQRYDGTLNRAFCDKSERLLESGEWNPVLNLQGTDFILSRGSVRGTRYRYKLQAKALGVVIHYGSYFYDVEHFLDEDKGKVKYEISPQLIYDNGLEAIEYMISSFNQSIMCAFHPAGTDVHLAVDVQGWYPDESMVSDMVTMTHKEPTYHYGIDKAEFSHSLAAVRYGRLDSIRWGNHATSELEIYRKSEEAKIKGTTSFWSSVYEFDNPQYDPEKDVHRIELRMPHTTLKKLVKRDDGSPILMLDILTTSQYLNQIWVYGLSRLFRFDYPRSSSNNKMKTIKPIWQMLLDDVSFNDNYTPTDFKQQHITVDDSIDKNITLALGNLSTALAKAGCTEQEFLDTLQGMPIYRQLLEYARDKKDLNEQHYLDYMCDIFRKKSIEYNRKAQISKEMFKEYRRNYKSSQELEAGWNRY